MRTLETSKTTDEPSLIARTTARALPALREPIEHAHRAERVPTARPAFAVLHLEMGFARVDVVERPAAVGIPSRLDDADRLGDARIGLLPGLA